MNYKKDKIETKKVLNYKKRKKKCRLQVILESQFMCVFFGWSSSHLKFTLRIALFLSLSTPKAALFFFNH